MLARRVMLALAVGLLATSAVRADHRGSWGVGIGHSPGPVTRYDWNPGHRPYGGNFGGGLYGGVGGFSFGIGSPYAGWYGPYAGYGGPVVVAPYGYYDGWYPQYAPSTATYGYVPRSPFLAPYPAQPPLQPVPVDPLNELAPAVSNLRSREPLSTEDRLPTLKPSTPEAQQRSLHHMATGDQQLRMAHYSGAALEYRRAIADAEDLPDNYFRLGFTLAAQRRYDEAVQQLRYGLTLDPTWPSRGEPLASVFGENNAFEKTALVHRVADFVRLDPRDPDRIFLLGVLLHFDGDRANARTLFESASRVVGNEPWLTAFLTPQDQSAPAPQAPVNGSSIPQSSLAQPSTPPSTLPAPSTSNSAVPTPPPANVNRPRANFVPRPAEPESPQPVPQRQSTPPQPSPDNQPPEPQKFPNLQTPALPGTINTAPRPTTPAPTLPALPSEI